MARRSRRRAQCRQLRGLPDTRFLGDLYQDLSEAVRKRYALLQTPDFVEKFILEQTLGPAIEEFGLAEVKLIDPTCGSGHFLLGAFRELLAAWQAKEPMTAVEELARRALDQVYGVDINPYAVAIARFRLVLARHACVCHRKYSLAVPFTRVFFELARLDTGERIGSGFVGMITANSFMKREFGRKLIEGYLAESTQLTHVIDLSGAYVPGHGTPTVILLGRSRRPNQSTTIRAVLGIRGEPGTPDDPAAGLVWTAIVRQVDVPGSQSAFVSAADVARARFAMHPWSTGGGGASDLKESIEEHFETSLSDTVDVVGVLGMTNADEVMLAPRSAFVRRRVEQACVRPLVLGDLVRDWGVGPTESVLFPYIDSDLQDLEGLSGMVRWLWQARTVLGRRATFSKSTYFDEGRPWWEWHQVALERLRTPLTITYAEVATHNHFVLDRGGKVFKQTAPVIKLPAGASEDEHLGLLGILNSSTVCFWLQQVCHNKGGPGGGSSKDEKWHDFFAFNASNVQALPLPDGRPLELARLLDGAATTLRENEPSAVLARTVFEPAEFEAIRRVWEATRERMVFLQEELDWRCYRLYGLIEDDLCYSDTDVAGIHVGERAFEIALARQVAAATVETEWFDWLHVTPCTEPPAQWPASYRALVQRRISAIESNRDLALLEQMQCKRRWEAPSWGDLLARAQRDWLLDRMEDPRHWPGPELISTARFADRLQRDTEFLRVAELYVHPKLLDLEALVRELVEGEGVPFLAALRYKPSGLRKRAAWERTWELQRQEDAIDARVALPERDPRHLSSEQAQAEKARVVGAIDVPPKYAQADFQKASSWRLRGKLDVPKERFVLYPHAEAAGDASPVFTWAGFDHLQQGQALGAWLNERRERDAWTSAQCVPLLAGLQELLPWIRQWHDEPSAEFGGLRMGEYFQDFLAGQLRQLGLRVEQLVDWRPPARRGRGRARAAQVDAEDEETDA
jgi:hypothetical protein